MKRVISLLLSLVLIWAAATHSLRRSLDAQAPQKTERARGYVFHDRNGNGRRDSGEPGLADVRAFNGRTITTTDADGQYQIDVGQDTIIFVVKPRGWRTPLNGQQLPQFYYIHKPKGSPADLKYPGVAATGPLPASVDFALTPQNEPDKFRAILFGDPQPRNQAEVDYIAHDVVEELVGTQASFGVTLGDIVFDDLSLFESQAKTIALLGIPWYNVIGNHDINRDVKHDSLSDETFERVFGPAYYSFDYGPVHFLVLDDIEWYLGGADGKGTYRGGLGPQQMEFIRNDLARIPKQQLVVLLMHIPLVDVRDRQELYRLIEQRPFCISISGHTHHHEHRFITREDGWLGPQPHHHIINVTVSGSWWSGAPDERGIPHTTMADGAPNGYSIISFDGQKYALDFRAAGRPADYQMQIHAPEVISRSQSADTQIFVNVFNGSERSRVEMRLGRDQRWRKMERVVAVDPAFQDVVDSEAAIKDKSWRALPNPKPSTHLWRANLPQNLTPGTHLIQIRSTDWQHRQQSAQRVIRVRDN